MIVHKVVFTLGSLEVYTKRHLTLDLASQELPGFYWTDKDVPMGCGPFVSIHQAMEYYTIVTKSRKLGKPKLTLVSDNPAPIIDPTNVPEGRLIQVDFVNRKRIS